MKDLTDARYVGSANVIIINYPDGGMKQQIIMRDGVTLGKQYWSKNRMLERVVHYRDGKKSLELCERGAVTVRYDDNENRLTEEFRPDPAAPAVMRVTYDTLEEDGFVKMDGLRHDGSTEFSALYYDLRHCKFALHDEHGQPMAHMVLQDHVVERTSLDDTLLQQNDFAIYDASGAEMRFNDHEKRQHMFERFKQAWNDKVQPVALPIKALAMHRHDRLEQKQDEDDRKMRHSCYRDVVKRLTF